MAVKQVYELDSDLIIEFTDNGYVMRYSGRDKDDDWVEVKLVMTNMDQVIEQLKFVDLNRKQDDE